MKTIWNINGNTFGISTHIFWPWLILKIPPALWATGGLEGTVWPAFLQSLLPRFPGEGFTPPLTLHWRPPLKEWNVHLNRLSMISRVVSLDLYVFRWILTSSNGFNDCRIFFHEFEFLWRSINLDGFHLFRCSLVFVNDYICLWLFLSVCNDLMHYNDYVRSFVHMNGFWWFSTFKTSDSSGPWDVHCLIPDAGSYPK